MQMLINISEEQYESIKKNNFKNGVSPSILDAIRNGKPLPKEHGRLIDGDELKANVQGWYAFMREIKQIHMTLGEKDFIAKIDNAETVEAIPKADYEARLKADLKAILVELQLEIEEKATELCDDGWWLTYNNLIQEKIDKLKENKK